MCPHLRSFNKCTFVHRICFSLSLSDYGFALCDSCVSASSVKKLQTACNFIMQQFSTVIIKWLSFKRPNSCHFVTTLVFTVDEFQLCKWELVHAPSFSIFIVIILYLIFPRFWHNFVLIWKCCAFEMLNRFMNSFLGCQ